MSVKTGQVAHPARQLAREDANRPGAKATPDCLHSPVVEQHLVADPC